ncbi:hypothetical protein ACTPL8_002800 [Enterococcus faecium]
MAVFFSIYFSDLNYLPEGSTVEIYHTEGPWHRFNTDDNDNLKTKLGKTGYTYTYKMQNNQLVLTNVQ